MKITVDLEHGSDYPRTPEQYVELVDQALFELSDTRSSLEYDMEGIPTRMLEALDGLEAELRRLRASMADGSYVFDDQDLPFMPLIANLDIQVLPFKRLLEDINRVHRNGLWVEED